MNIKKKQKKKKIKKIFKTMTTVINLYPVKYMKQDFNNNCNQWILMIQIDWVIKFKWCLENQVVAML